MANIFCGIYQSLFVSSGIILLNMSWLLPFKTSPIHNDTIPYLILHDHFQLTHKINEYTWNKLYCPESNWIQYNYDRIRTQLVGQCSIHVTLHSPYISQKNIPYHMEKYLLVNTANFSFPVLVSMLYSCHKKGLYGTDHLYRVVNSICSFMPYNDPAQYLLYYITHERDWTLSGHSRWSTF
jgi:hypothetical protein